MDDVNTVFRICFAKYGIFTNPSRKNLVDALTCCFHIPNIPLEPLDKAIKILEALFQTDITPYLPKVNPETVITELLYSLYYEGLPNHSIQFLLLQITGHKANREDLVSLINKLSAKQKLEAVAFAFTHYREGSSAILNELEELKPVIYGLKQNYYDLPYFHKKLASDRLLDELEQKAEKETIACFALLSTLVPLVKSAMLKVYDAIDKPNSKIVVQHKEQFEHIFTIPYTLTAFQNFTRLFGLSAYPPVFIDDFNESDSLKDKLTDLCTILKNDAPLQNVEVVQIYSFVSVVLRHIEATSDNTKLKTELLTCTMATCGKDLCKSPTLLTLIDGYKLVASDLSSHPIFVFDQSDEALYKSNKAYIDTLNKEYNSHIQSLSKANTLKLAKKLKLTDLIDTTQEGYFGFGGARNCQFLLTGVLKAAYSLGKKTVDEVLTLDVDELALLFKSHVLTSQGTLLLIDDDVELPKTAIFSNALLAASISTEYNSSAYYQYGRRTGYGQRYWSLQELLTTPEKIVLFPQWSDLPLSAGISNYACKPKICINLPHGCEERHLWQPTKTHFALQPSYHLSGSRYPSGPIPTSPFVGISEYLKSNLPYVFMLGMISTLVDPSNNLKQCALPWNDEIYHDQITSLKDALQIMTKKETEDALINRFLRNVQHFFGLRYEQPNAYLDAVHHLMSERIDTPEVIDALEQKSLTELCNIYRSTQEDIRLFWRFGKELSLSTAPDALAQIIEQTKKQIEQETNQPLSSYPITEGFYLLARALGKGEFCKIIRALNALLDKQPETNPIRNPSILE